jgi:hypothetical protein
MPLIHHPVTLREITVSETAADILTTQPRAPWKRGPLRKRPKPTAIPDQPSPEGDTTPSTEED